MNKPFMSYYEHIAKLSVIANKQTVFLSHLLCRMEYHGQSKSLVVEMNPKVKRDIISLMEIESKNPLRLASQYLIKLQRAGLVKSIGGGRFLIDPSSYGYGKYVPKALRDSAAEIYVNATFNEAGDITTVVKVCKETGEIIEA